MNARRILLLISIALAVCVTGAIAETNTVTIDDVTLQPGATQEVPIRLLGSTGVSGVMVTLTFSPSIVNVTRVVAGDFDGMFTSDESGVSNGVLKVTSMKSGQDLSGDLVIATITLGAAGDGGSCELGLHADLTDQSGHAVTSSVDNGTLAVGSGAATTDNMTTDNVTTGNVTNASTFEGGDSLAASTPTAAPTLALALPSTPTPTVTSNVTTTTTAANTAAPAAATTQTTTAPVAGGDKTMPDAPAKKGLPGFEGAIAITGLLAIGYVVMRRKR